MFDDIFAGEPRDKFYDIIFNANRNIVANELDKILAELANLREIVAQKGMSEAEIFTFSANNANLIESGLNDIYIGVVGEILSQNE